MVSFDVAGRTVVPVTVAIPTHPARGDAFDGGSLLGQAVASVFRQTVQPSGGLSIACDLEGRGAAFTRQRALDGVDTEWVSFLDSDDVWYPHHLQTHCDLLHESGADVAYSWFDGNDPFPMHRGRRFDPADPHHLTMTLTVRTELAKRVGFAGDALHVDWSGEDWRMILGLRDLGARFVGTGEVTWTYRVHSANTSGHPHLGDGPNAMPAQ